MQFSVAFFPGSISLTYSRGKVFEISVLCRLDTSLRPRLLELPVSRCMCDSCTCDILTLGRLLIFLQAKVFNFTEIHKLRLFKICCPHGYSI